KVWDVETGQEALSLTVPGPVTWVAFAPDGQALMAARQGGIEIWESRQVVQGLPLAGHIAPVLALAFSRDGRFAASGSLNFGVKVWDTRTGQAVLSPREHTGGIRSLAFSPDGALLASGGQDLVVKITDLRTGQVIATLPKHEMSVFGLAFS